MTDTTMREQPSVIITFYNEEGCAEEVVREALSVLPHAEIVAVDDGSTDRTQKILQSIPGIVVVSLGRNRGQGVALYEGLSRATREICAVMDGDGQSDPRDIRRAIALLDRHDCAWGYRAQRQDTILRRAAGKAANRIRRAILGDDGVRDVGCSVRAFRREHLRHLSSFEGMHRFMPTLFRAAGLSIVEFPANHRKRLAGASKYTVGGRALRGARDIFRVRAIIGTWK